MYTANILHPFHAHARGSRACVREQRWLVRWVDGRLRSRQSYISNKTLRCLWVDCSRGLSCVARPALSRKRYRIYPRNEVRRAYRDEANETFHSWWQLVMTSSWGDCSHLSPHGRNGRWRGGDFLSSVRSARVERGATIASTSLLTCQ